MDQLFRTKPTHFEAAVLHCLTLCVISCRPPSARALYDCDGDDEQELSFVKGEMLYNGELSSVLLHHYKFIIIVRACIKISHTIAEIYPILDAASL